MLAISIGFLVPKTAQSDQYSKMVPVDQYLMEKNTEILLARSASLVYATSQIGHRLTHWTQLVLPLRTAFVTINSVSSIAWRPAVHI